MSKTANQNLSTDLVDKADEIGKEIEESITQLDEKTAEKVKKTHQKRYANRVMKTAALKEKVETKELQQKLEALNFPSVKQILKKGMGHYAILLNNNIPATLFMTFVACGLVLAHTIGMASVLTTLKANPMMAYPLAFVLSAAFEVSMTVFVIDFKHKNAKLTMWSVITAMTLMAALEMYYKKPDGMDWLEALKQVDIITWLRLISGSLMVPVVKALAVTARDSGGKKKTKKHFDRMAEDNQKEILRELKKIKNDFEDAQRKNKKFVKVSYDQFSNAYKIYQHSLKEICVKIGVYNKAVFSGLPKERKLTDKFKIDPVLAQEVVKFIDSNWEIRKDNIKPAGIELQFMGRVNQAQAKAILKQHREEYYNELFPKKEKTPKEKKK